MGLFLEQADEDVTLTAIAAAAKVSHQTVLNHFESKESVAFAAAEILRQQTASTRDAAKPGDVRGRGVDSGRRLRADWRCQHPLGRCRPSGSAGWRRCSTTREPGTSSGCGTFLSDSLPSTPAARQRAVNALHAVTDVYVWKLLRRDLLSRVETERIMVDLVTGSIGCTSRR